MSRTHHDVESTARNWVWVPDKADVFKKGYVADELPDKKLKIVFEDNTDSVVNASDAEKVNPAKFDKVDDMAELTFLNEPSVLHNLERRYKDDLIYTYSGLFLVAVNPYSKLPIYGDDYIKMYNNSPKEQNKPHIFAETEETFRNLLKEKKDQSILVTGESGAGKTENTKKIIQYLASITSNDHSKQSFEQQIIQANPVLESFGNAQTVKNNNSSRFGKFIKIMFSDSGKICGAHIDWYLLEKSRVVNNSVNERNYHIFYQLLTGLSDQVLKSLGLTRSPHDYQYLKNGNAIVPGVDDKQEFKKLIQSFDILGVSDSDYSEIFKIIAIILHIGNIEFTSQTSDHANFKSNTDKLCQLLGVSTREFSEAILKPKVKAGREILKRSNNAVKARFSLDALSKSLYEKVFKLLVDILNNNLDSNTSALAQNFIGVLDIAGFEIFKQNSFEQFCINYTNEKLQQFFNHHMFVLEQEEYIKENIDWNFIDFGQDLQQTINLIENNKAPIGIFSILDEECIVPKSTDQSFFDKLKQHCDDSLGRFKTSRFSNKFTLKHYAGEVEYSTDSWIEKNRDPLNDNVLQILNSSSNKFIASLYQSASTDSSSKNSSFRTVAQKHKEQLNSLMTQLTNTTPHFVRCIIPNHKKKPQNFDRALVLDQLKCNGVLEGIRIVRSGYPNRILFSEFYDRYRILAKNSNFTADMKDNCTKILLSIEFNTELYKIGLTKLFFKSGVLNDLEVKRDLKIKQTLTHFQAFVKGQLKRRQIDQQLQKFQAAQVLANAIKSYSKLSQNPWFNLYTNIKPLITSSDQVNKQKKIGEKVKTLEKKLEDLEKEKSEISTKFSSTEDEVNKLNSILEKERSILKDKEEIIIESKKKSEALESELKKTIENMKVLETQRDEFKRSKEGLDEQLKLYVSNLEKGKQLMSVLEKEKSLLNDKIVDLEVELKQAHESKESFVKDSTKVKEELKMLKKLLSSKESMIADLELKISNSEKDLQEKVNEANVNFNKTNQKLKELIEENKTLHSQLKSAQGSSQQYESIVNKKEFDLKKLQDQLDQKSQEIAKLQKEKNDLNKEQSNVSKELMSVRSDMSSLKAKYKQLEHEANEARDLLQRKISDEIKFNRGKQKYDLEMTELQGKLDAVNNDLNEERNRSLELEQKIKELRVANQDLEKSRKASGVFSAQSSFSTLGSRSNFGTNIDRLEDDKVQLLQEYAQIKLKLNEQSATLKKETIEKGKLETELKLFKARLASEAFDKLQLQIKLNKIKEGIASNLSPLNYDETYERLNQENSNLQAQISKLKIDLDIERKSFKRANDINGDLQKQVQDYKPTSPTSSTNSDEHQFKLKYEASEARVRLLERKLAEKSSPLKDISNNKRPLSTGNVSVSSSSSKEYLGFLPDVGQSLKFTKNELSITKDKVSKLEEELSKSKQIIQEFQKNDGKSLTSQLIREELTKLQLRLEGVENKNQDLNKSVTLYKNRSEDYFSKLEGAEAAVRTSKHAEKYAKERLKESQETIAKLNEQIKNGEISIRKLSVTINQLKDQLEDRENDIIKKESSIVLLQEEVNYCRQRLLTSSTNEEHQHHLKKLEDEISRSLRTETELRKNIGSLELELDHLQSKYHQETTQLTKEKSYYLKLCNELEEKNEKSETLQKDLEIKLRSLMTQITSLNKSVDSLILERDSLQSDKKRLEGQIQELSNEYTKFNNEREIASDLEKTLRESIKKYQSELSDLQNLNKQVQRSEDKIKMELEDSRQKNVMIIAENQSLGKFNEQLKSRISELEEKLAIDHDAPWIERVSNIEDKLSAEISKSLEMNKRNKSLERDIEGLSQEIEQQKAVISNAKEEKARYEFKINELFDSINKWQSVDSNSKLELKRNEREIRYLKQHSLELEKELEEWKERFQSLTTKQRALVNDDVFI